MDKYKESHVRRPLKHGDERYLCGGRTKVRVISHVDSMTPRCLVIEVSPTSKFTVGYIKRFRRVNLGFSKRR